jgi:hypothetical protein
VKGSKDRFLERAETREDGAKPYPQAYWPKDLPFSPQPEANWRALYGGKAAIMQAPGSAELYFLSAPIVEGFGHRIDICLEAARFRGTLVLIAALLIEAMGGCRTLEGDPNETQRMASASIAAIKALLTPRKRASGET